MVLLRYFEWLLGCSGGAQLHNGISHNALFICRVGKGSSIRGGSLALQHRHRVRPKLLVRSGYGLDPAGSSYDVRSTSGFTGSG